MKTLLTVAAALLLSTAAMAAEPEKPITSDPHGSPAADTAADNDAMTADETSGMDDSSADVEEPPKATSSDPHTEE